uniref:ANK_REP_REGION domain-containing protein n=1 Tax=Macrostomum lignano TaxID=282301 RepID=A0A1I8F6V6_9PLAT
RSGRRQRGGPPPSSAASVADKRPEPTELRCSDAGSAGSGSVRYSSTSDLSNLRSQTRYSHDDSSPGVGGGGSGGAEAATVRHRGRQPPTVTGAGLDEEQRFLREIASSVLAGQGVGFITRSMRLNSLMAQERCRAFLLQLLHSGARPPDLACRRARTKFGAGRLADVPLRPAVFRGLLDVLRAAVAGLTAQHCAGGGGDGEYAVSSQKQRQMARFEAWARTRPHRRQSPARVSQQTVDVAPSPRLSPPHLLHRLRTVGLGADDVACQLESPTAQQIARTGQAGAMIERRVGDSLVADLEGGAQQASVRRVDLSLERVSALYNRTVSITAWNSAALWRSGKSSATPQILADVGNQTAEVDELLTSWKLTRLSVSASAEDCSLGVHDGLLRVDHQADARRNGNQPIQLSLGALDGRGQQGEVIGVAKHAEPSLRLASTHASPQQEAVVPSCRGHDSRNQQLWHVVRTEHLWERVPHDRVEGLPEIDEDQDQGQLADARLLDDSPKSQDLRHCAAMGPESVLLRPQADASMLLELGGARLLWKRAFITLATSVATQWIRSASVGTSSGPSALPPGDCRANFTTSAVLTGATLKLSSAGNGVSGGSLRFSGSGGGGALTMAAKNSRSSFLRSSGVSPARLSAMRRFRPSVDDGPGHAPSGIGPCGRDGLDGVIDSGLLPLQVDSRQSLLRLASLPPTQTEPLQIFPRFVDRGVVLPDRLPALGRSHQRDCLLRSGSNCSAHLRVLGSSTLVAQRSDKGTGKATSRLGVPERAVVRARWPLWRTVERVPKPKVADEQPMVGPQSQRRNGAAVGDAAALTKAHKHVVELCQPPRSVRPRARSAASACSPRRSRACPRSGVAVLARCHEQRSLGPTQNCVQVSENDHCVTLRHLLHPHRELLEEGLSLIGRGSDEKQRE